MPDTYSVNLTHELTDKSRVWAFIRMTVQAVEATQAGPGHFDRDTGLWELRTHDDRNWTRSTLDELRTIAEDHELSSFTLSWNEAWDDVQWMVDAWIYEGSGSNMRARVYAGKDRMLTEHAAKKVADAVRGRGLAFVSEPTKTSSIDAGLGGTRAQSSGVANRRPSLVVRFLKGLWTDFRGIVIAVSALVIGTAILAVFNIG